MRVSEIFAGVPHVESPLFPHALDELPLTEEERRIAIDLYVRGYALIDFPDPDLGARIDRIKTNLLPMFDVDMADPAVDKCAGRVRRVQDAWLFDEDVKSIAINQQVMALLSKLYGREAFAFQTLNFPVGSQQHLHTDSVHFSSVPERFMCGVWLAFEDVAPGAGPLTYVPGSNRWPILTNAMIGRRGYQSTSDSAQSPFEQAWMDMVKVTGLQQETFSARKGQALIWAANLLHGGSRQDDPMLTRWSQVTHYYFKDCIYYTPAFSDEPLGLLDLRSVRNVATGAIEPNRYLGEDVFARAERPKSIGGKLLRALKKSIAGLGSSARLPDDFDEVMYLRLNPDVAVQGLSAGEHYIRHGAQEGRRYKVA